MKIAIQLFARARDLVGADCVELEVPADARVCDLKQLLAARFPQVSPLVPNLLVAIGSDYADDRTVLNADSEVACFPPVSGG